MQKELTTLDIRSRMKVSARGGNNVLTDKIMDNMSFYVLNNNCHPFDRQQFRDQMNIVEDRERELRRKRNEEN